MNANQATGKYGENIAAQYLQDQGYRILIRNWRGTRGELDIIAQRDDLVAVVEVKTRRSSRFGHPAEAVGTQKLARIKGLAAQWLSAQPRHITAVRFDVIAVNCLPSGRVKIDHLEAVA